MKTVISASIRIEVLQALDEWRESQRPRPSRSETIETAIADYIVDKDVKKTKRPGS